MKPNFYCSVDAMELLMNMKLTAEPTEQPLTVDVIEMPYLLSYACDAENARVICFLRGEIYSHDDSGIKRGTITIRKEDGQGQVSAQKDVAELMPMFFSFCRQLSAYIAQENLMAQWGDMDPDDGGFLLTAKDLRLSINLVTGKQRPRLCCEKLLGGTAMMRPYMDDFLEASRVDMESLDDLTAQAAEGNEAALDRLYMIYLNGDEELKIKADVNEAVRWLKKYIETNNSNALFNMALHYMKGFGVARDFDKAYEMMVRADENGDEDAATWIDKLRSMPATVAAAGRGDAQAAADYARLLMELGRVLEQAGDEKDFRECLLWAKKAADQNNGDGLWILGLAYQHGRGTPKDLKQAAKYYLRGAELGNASCQNSIAVMYFDGDPVPKDMKQGFEWTRKAALQGHALAMYNLGRCYQFGHGVQDDMSKAIEWYEKSLELRPDDELARKVAIFKHLEQITKEQQNAPEKDSKPAAPETKKSPPKVTLPTIGMKPAAPAAEKKPQPSAEKKQPTAEQEARRRQQMLSKARNEITKLCGQQLDAAKKKLTDGVCSKNAAAAQKAFADAIQAKEAERLTLTNTLSAQGLFALARKKELRQQIADVDAKIAALRGLTGPAANFAGNATLAQAIATLCSNPGAYKTAAQLCGTENATVTAPLMKSLNELKDKGLLLRHPSNIPSAYCPAAYPAAYTPAAMPAERDFAREALRMVIEKERLQVQGTATEESAAQALCQLMLEGRWHSAEDKARSSANAEADRIKTLILRVLDRKGKTVSEIQASHPTLSTVSNMQLSSLIRQMVQDGDVERFEKDRKAYFRL